MHVREQLIVLFESDNIYFEAITSTPDSFVHLFTMLNVCSQLIYLSFGIHMCLHQGMIMQFVVQNIYTLR